MASDTTTEPATITAAEYEKARRRDAAGPLTELLPENQDLYGAGGATHWQVTFEAAGTVLRPVVVKG